MRRAAVICEFNPFHNGHKFLLEKIKQEYADEIICVMSGSFVQRGEIAIVNKFERAEAALRNGADMVVELPTAYAVSSARTFAQSGVRIAKALSCDKLCFGAESSAEELANLCEAFDNISVKELIQLKMDEGLYYPRALSEAVGAVFGADAAEKMSLSNNILALEYIKACKGSGILPAAIKRKGVSHDSGKVSGDIASASFIRRLVMEKKDYSLFTPMTIIAPSDPNRLESAVIYALKTKSAQDIARLAEVSEGLENRIFEAAQHYNSTEEILNAAKTKRYTHARLRRILVSSLLGITFEAQNTPVPYLRILGIREGKEHLMKNAALPLVVKVKTDVDKLDNSVKEIFMLDVRASQAMDLARGEHINEFSQPLIKI